MTGFLTHSCQLYPTTRITPPSAPLKVEYWFNHSHHRAGPWGIKTNYSSPYGRAKNGPEAPYLLLISFIHWWVENWVATLVTSWIHSQTEDWSNHCPSFLWTHNTVILICWPCVVCCTAVPLSELFHAFFFLLFLWRSHPHLATSSKPQPSP